VFHLTLLDSTELNGAMISKTLIQRDVEWSKCDIIRCAYSPDTSQQFL